MASVRKVRKSGRDTGRWQGVAQVPRALWPTHGKTETHVVDGTGRAGEAAARRWAENREEVLAARLNDPGADLLIGDWYERVKLRLGHTGRTPGEVATLVRLYYVPRWGELPIAQWDPAEMEGWLARLQEQPEPGDRLPDRNGKLVPISSDRARTVLAHLKALVNKAVKDRVLAFNPIVGVTPPGVTESEPRFMPEDEFLTAVLWLPDHYRALVYGLAYTGCRFGEAAALRDESLVHDGQSLRINRTIVEDASCRVAWKMAPKGGKPRTVPLPGHVAEEWNAYRATRVSTGPVVLPVADARGRKRTITVDPWFRTAQGHPLCRHRLDAAWKAAQRKAGLTELYRVHDLRHLYASTLITAHQPLIAVQELMGHASARQTEVYAHLVKGWQDHARQALDRPEAALADRARAIAKSRETVAIPGTSATSLPPGPGPAQT